MSVQSIDPKAVAAPVWRLPWSAILLAFGIGLLTLWPFWDGLSKLWDAWLTSEEYSHGLLIPPVAAFLVWQQKDRLERIPFSGSWWGVAILLLACFLLAVGQLGTVYVIVAYAYVVALY